jgi:hypothetical protein
MSSKFFAIILSIALVGGFVFLVERITVAERFLLWDLQSSVTSASKQTATLANTEGLLLGNSDLPPKVKKGWKVGVGVGFKFQYPKSTFALVKVISKLPPNYKHSYSGLKLISSARISKLGKRECFYGQSDLPSICKAEMESGIEFIHVKASIQKLTSVLDDSLKSTVTLAGRKAIKWSIGAEKEGSDYYYVSLNSNQTLVVVRVYRSDGFPKQDLFDRVLATLVVKQSKSSALQKNKKSYSLRGVKMKCKCAT